MCCLTKLSLMAISASAKVSFSFRVASFSLHAFSFSACRKSATWSASTVRSSPIRTWSSSILATSCKWIKTLPVRVPKIHTSRSKNHKFSDWAMILGDADLLVEELHRWWWRRAALGATAEADEVVLAILPRPAPPSLQLPRLHHHPNFLH